MRSVDRGNARHIKNVCPNDEARKFHVLCCDGLSRLRMGVGMGYPAIQLGVILHRSGLLTSGRESVPDDSIVMRLMDKLRLEHCC